MMQILLFGDAMTFSDFIFKGTLITWKRQTRAQNSENSIGFIGITWT